MAISNGQRMLPNNKSLVFLHIPKTAGTTLNSIINRYYPQDAIFNLDGSNESSTEFKCLPEKERAGIRCLRGHMRFGLHEYLPQPCTYITIIRDPVDRIISHYYFVLRHEDHYLHDAVKARNMTLQDYACSELSGELSNGQTRLISGIAKVYSVTSSGRLSTNHLEIAKRNMQEHFAVVGLSERFDETLILLKKVFRWRNIFYAKHNVGTNRPRKTDIPKYILNLIETRNEQDIELYNFAKQMFEDRINQQGLSFKSELKTFQLFNKVYQVSYKSAANRVYLRDWIHNVKGQ